MTKRRILVALESRSTYGYSRNVLRAMEKFPELEARTLVTGMHLMEELGNSLALIEADGIPISETVEFSPSDASRTAWVKAMGPAISGFADAIERQDPDFILLSGDRAETLGICIAAAYMGYPLAHIQAGDKSGHIDDAARFAIAKLAHVHLASCQDSADRLLRMGEQPFRVFDVGAPQLDDIADRSFEAAQLDIAGVSRDLSAPYLVMVFHPTMAEREEAGEQVRNVLDACIDTGLPVYWIYPNSDLGYRQILAVMGEDLPNRVVRLDNLDRDDYLTLIANAAALVGNSSSGILEAPSFRIPVVNVGNRQRGRPQAANLTNCGYAKDDVAAALRHALEDDAFRQACATAVNPYGDGRSGPRICEILRDTPIDRKLMDKENVY